LPSQGTFAKKIAFADDRDGRFLARLGNDGEPDFAFLNIEDRVGASLGEDDLLFGTDRIFLPSPIVARKVSESNSLFFLLNAGRRMNSDYSLAQAANLQNLRCAEFSQVSYFAQYFEPG